MLQLRTRRAAGSRSDWPLPLKSTWFEYWDEQRRIFPLPLLLISRIFFDFFSKQTKGRECEHFNLNWKKANRSLQKLFANFMFQKNSNKKRKCKWGPDHARSRLFDVGVVFSGRFDAIVRLVEHEERHLGRNRPVHCSHAQFDLETIDTWQDRTFFYN